MCENFVVLMSRMVQIFGHSLLPSGINISQYASLYGLQCHKISRLNSAERKGKIHDKGRVAKTSHFIDVGNFDEVQYLTLSKMVQSYC